MTLTLIRHWSAVLAAIIITWIAGLLGIEVSAEAVEGLTAALTWIGLGIFAWSYVTLEKALKPLARRFGEVQPGEVNHHPDDIRSRRRV